MGNANSSNSSRDNTETAVKRDVEAVSSGPVASPGMPADGRIPTTTVNVSSPRPSPLATAENFGHVQYSEGIRSPKVELNVNVPAGKFRQAGVVGVKGMDNHPALHINKLSNEERFAKPSNSRSVFMDGLAGMPIGNNSYLSTAPPTSLTSQSDDPRSRRPSTLGLSVSVKDADNAPVSHRTASAAKSAPPVKSTADGVKIFGSVAVQDGTSKAALARLSSLSSTSNTFASTSTAPSSIPKSKAFEVSKLFQGPSKTTPTPPSAEASASPSSRPSSLPPAAYVGQPFTPRGQGQNGSNASGPPPRSPSYARPMTNGSGMGGRPAAGPGGPSAVPGNIPPVMSSPRLGPHPTSHPGQKAGLPLPTPPIRQGYYPPQQRRKLQLLPQSKHVETKDVAAVSSEAALDEESGKEGVSAISEADALKKIGEVTKMFFSTRSLDETETYFSSLPQEHRFRLVDRLAMRAVKSEADTQLVADFFMRVREKNLASPALLEKGLTPLAEIIDSIVIDAPKPLYLFAIMLKGAGLREDEERRARIAAKSMDSDKLLSLLALDARVDYWHDAQFKKQIFRDIAEFFRLRLVSEAEAYFVNLPPMHRPFLIRKIAERAMTSSLDANLAVDLFQTVWRKGLCSEASLEYGLGLLDDFPRP